MDATARIEGIDERAIVTSAGEAPKALSLQRLEDEICELSAHIWAATCRWLCLVAEFERREGWKESDCVSCAQWLSWRCGLAPGAAREQLRVARRLLELPKIRAAFARGELSYSKVRAVTRVASPKTEEDLLMLAQHATAAQLERLVRTYRGIVVSEIARQNRSYRQRELVWYWDDDGSLVIHGRLPAEDGALLLRALEVGRDELRAAARAADRDAPGPIAGAPRAELAVENVSAETPTDQITAAAEPGPAPAEACGSSKIAAHSEHSSAETSRRQVESNACGVSPETSTPGIASPKPERVSAETPAAETAELEQPDLASEHPGAANNADALVLMAETLLASGSHTRAGADRRQVVVHVDTGVLTHGDPAGRCELEEGTALPAETARRLACDAALVTIIERHGRPLSVGRKTRAIPSALERALRSRDGGCRFPGCDRRRFVDAHHIHHWAEGGETKLSNLVLLCRHHHRLLHEHGYHAERSGQGVVFRRPDGRLVTRVPHARRGERARLIEANRGLGLDIGPDTPVAQSAGDRIDYDITIGGLLFLEGLVDSKDFADVPPWEQAS